MNIIAKLHIIDAVVQQKENHTISNIEMVLERKKTGKNVVIEKYGNYLFFNKKKDPMILIIYGFYILDDQKGLMITPVLCRMQYLVTMLTFIDDQWIGYFSFIW